MILASKVYGMLLSVDHGPRDVVYEDVLRFVCGKSDKLSAPYVPGIMRQNQRGENEEHCAGYVWIELAATGAGGARSYGVAVRIDPKVTTGSDPALALRFGQVLCEVATVARVLEEVLP